MGQSFYELVLQAALSQDCLAPEQPLAAFVDTAGVERTVRSLHEAFPRNFEHAFAAKANSMRKALELVRSAGMACEVASRGEYEQAIRAGFAPNDIVYDEPAKLPRVLEDVLTRGAGLNIDNFQEFDRVRALLERSPSASRIGFRINPQVGSGSIVAMSTATGSSS